MIILNLVGGLGNQLFQVAAAQALAKPDEEIILEYGLGTTRLLASGEPEICSFQLPGNYQISKREGNLAFGIARIIGYTLRKRKEKNKYFSWPVLVMCNLILLAYYMKPVKLICPEDLGYTEIIRSKNIFLSGYFQTYVWPSEINEFLSKMAADSPELQFYKELAAVESPLIIHIRRGDYKTEDTFGLLGSAYYTEALKHLNEKHKFNNVWLFSDENDLALEVLKIPSHMRVRIISNLNWTSAQLLEVMKLGHAYIIANSTFSWWGAFLSQSSQVIAPRTWFKGADSPSKLLPQDWQTIESNFE